MAPPIPTELVDLFAGAGGITLGIAWFVVQLTKTIVPPAVDHLSQRRLLQTIERLADVSPSARIELTREGFVFDPRPPPEPPLRPRAVLRENVTGLVAASIRRTRSGSRRSSPARRQTRRTLLKLSAVETEARLPP
jgi:site-specific DNA-cytosine methylase